MAGKVEIVRSVLRMHHVLTVTVVDRLNAYVTSTGLGLHVISA